MNESEARFEAARVAPSFPISVTKFGDGYRAVPDHFPYLSSCDSSPELARSYAFHLLMTTLICRLIDDRPIPEVPVAQ